MQQKKSRLIPIGLISLCLAFASACGSEKKADPVQPEAGSTEPISLTFYSAQGAVLDQFGALDMLKAKFPHITFSVINSAVGSRYTDLITAGTQLDIVFEANSLMRSTIIEFGLHYDHDDLIKKHKFDLNRIEPNILSQAKFSNTEGKLYGIPYSINRYALVYNKDLFNRFGVPYPKDGMTWDEIYELSKKMNREEGGVFYQGFAINTPGSYMLNNQLSLDPLDPKEDKAAVNNDGFKKLYENLKRFYELPNAKVATPDFTKGQAAMLVTAVSTSQFKLYGETQGLNWDMASLPVFADKRNTGFKPAGLSLFVTQTSKVKDQAFQVVAYMVSDEFQTKLARNGGGTVLVNDVVRSQAGQDVATAKDKNVKALYYYPFAPSSPPRANQLTDVSVNFANSFQKMIETQADVNTTLRSLEEEVNKAIAAAKTAK
ncbi:MAG: extracellular solute-binding protein family 1 [Paenibacillus sp.]|jgi:multiple sugar transport system substrate-binding protein|nr:extracellular solute-binding protein family 1 [Paenibacillus sp.]